MEISTLFELLVTYSLPVIVTVNIHFERSKDSDTMKFVQILDSFDFEQFVKSLTHDLGRVLDVVITQTGLVPEDVAVTDVGISDHMLVTWSINLAPSIPEYTKSFRRCWRNFKFDDFINRLQETELCAPCATDASVDFLLNQFNNVITGLLDQMASVKEVTLRVR